MNFPHTLYTASQTRFCSTLATVSPTHFKILLEHDILERVGDEKNRKHTSARVIIWLVV